MARMLLFAAYLTLMLLVSSSSSTVLPAEATVATLQAYYKYIQSQDPAFFAGNVVSQDTIRIIHESSVALGVTNLVDNKLNWADTSARMNSVSELLVVAAALRLVSETVLPSLDTAIPSSLLPRGVSFFNPASTGTLLTLRHLMTHTSTITDSKFESFKTVSPSTVVTLRAFIEAYFLQSSGGQFSVSSDVWFTGTPGAAASYRYAKVNIALLAYIIESAVIERPTLVATGSAQTVAAYIQEKILAPYGMSSTYLRTVSGGFPTLSYPSGSAIFTGKAVLDYTSAGTEATTGTSLHPAYVSDYMYYTTATDLARLFRALFLDPKSLLLSIGTSMKDSPFSFAAGTTVFEYMNQQSQGIMYFSGEGICTLALQSAAITKCPLTATSVVWGSVSAGQYGQTLGLCTAAVEATNPTCVVVTLSHFDAGTSRKSLQYLLGMAAVAFQEAIGDSSSVETAITSDNDSTVIYGLWVSLGLLGVILFVFFASFITENLIQPAPVAAGIPVPTAVSRQ